MSKGKVDPLTVRRERETALQKQISKYLGRALTRECFSRSLYLSCLCIRFTGRFSGSPVSQACIHGTSGGERGLRDLKNSFSIFILLYSLSHIFVLRWCCYFPNSLQTSKLRWSLRSPESPKYSPKTNEKLISPSPRLAFFRRNPK